MPSHRYTTLPNGTSDPAWLQNTGPLVTVEIEMPGMEREAWQKAGHPKISPRTVEALVDTGASFSWIECHLANDLQLPQAVGQVRWASAAGGDPTPHSSYFAEIRFPGTELLPHACQAFAVRRIRPNYTVDLIIGRDILAMYELRYDGQGGWFELVRNPPTTSPSAP